MCILGDCNLLTQVGILKMHSRAKLKIDFDDMLLSAFYSFEDAVQIP